MGNHPLIYDCKPCDVVSVDNRFPDSPGIPFREKHEQHDGFKIYYLEALCIGDENPVAVFRGTDYHGNHINVKQEGSSGEFERVDDLFYEEIKKQHFARLLEGAKRHSQKKGG